MIKTLSAIAALLALSGGQALAAGPAKPPPAGAYEMDLSHASLNFRLSHMGLSHYTARFTRMSATLHFDPAHPAAQSVTAEIDAKSLQTNFPDPAKVDFDTQVEREFLEADKFPTITFRSTKVQPTGPKTAKVSGDLTLHGVTRPVTLDATYNGGFGPGLFGPMGARVGFSAKGKIQRSAFGILHGLPAPPMNIGVGDEIEVILEAEFSQPTPPQAR